MEQIKFNNKTVYPLSITPKVNQIWRNMDNNSLCIVRKIDKLGPSYLCENENGDKFKVGGAWLNGREYQCIGIVYNT